MVKCCRLHTRASPLPAPTNGPSSPWALGLSQPLHRWQPLCPLALYSLCYGHRPGTQWHTADICELGRRRAGLGRAGVQGPGFRAHSHWDARPFWGSCCTSLALRGMCSALLRGGYLRLSVLQSVLTPLPCALSLSPKKEHFCDLKMASCHEMACRGDARCCVQ